MKKYDYLEEANRIGIKICRDALWHDNRCNWIAPFYNEFEDGASKYFKPLRANLYDGLSGVAYFLLELYRATNEKVFADTAMGAINQAMLANEKTRDMGFFTGRTGSWYVQLKAGEILKNQQMTEVALRNFAGIKDIPLDEWKLDVIEGAAGVIPILLKISKNYNLPTVLDDAVMLGGMLIKNASVEPIGMSWASLNENGQKEHLLGLSHGAGGIAYSLLELYNATNEKRFLDTALQGFRYEDQWYSQAYNNWPDFRYPFANNSYSYVTAWCHGAPGIGLTRLRAYKLTQNGTFKELGETALESTVASTRKNLDYDNFNCSLCHGVFGNAELLLYASETLAREDLYRQAEVWADRCINYHDEKGIRWKCGTSDSDDVPGLMIGTSGIGYFFLRLAQKGAVENICLLTSD